jgi:hypothetical protein
MSEPFSHEPIGRAGIESFGASVTASTSPPSVMLEDEEELVGVEVDEVVLAVLDTPLWLDAVEVDVVF